LGVIFLTLERVKFFDNWIYRSKLKRFYGLVKFLYYRSIQVERYSKMKKQNIKNPVQRTHDSFDFNKNEELGCLDDLTYEVRKMASYFEFIADGGKTGYRDQDLTIYDYDMALAQDNADAYCCLHGHSKITYKDKLLALADAIKDYANAVDSVEDKAYTLERKIDDWAVKDDYGYVGSDYPSGGMGYDR
jgi:hypothetical protein